MSGEENRTEETKTSEKAPETEQKTEETKSSKEDFVSRSAYESVKADMHKFKEENKKLLDIQRKKEDEVLRSNEQWKEYAQKKELELDETKTKLHNFQEHYVTDRKRTAVREAALKSGIRQEALADLDLIPLDQVQLETTSTGRVNVLGVDDQVRILKDSRPHWFSDAKPPNVNSLDPTKTKSSPLNISDILKLQKEGKNREYEEALRQWQISNRR